MAALGLLAMLGTGGSGQCTPALGAGPAQTEARARLLRLRHEAADLLGPGGSRRAVAEVAAEAAKRLADLGAEPGSPEGALLSSALRADLRRAGGDLEATAKVGERFDPRPYLALLERARVELEGQIALGLPFQGSYSQTPPREPVYGGHASAMGPAPGPADPVPGPATVEPSPVQLEEAAWLPTRTYCGGPTKDHLLESLGTGVALFDYDGDGLLDVYLVNAAELTTSRERVPHRNALYRNRGGFRFEDVSKRAGVDAAAWGNGVCAGDYDGDGRLDLYVTNWGANLLFRNRGDGAFDETAERAGVAAGGWSTGCAFLDADADGDLDLYVARYVKTTWDDVAHAQRTLVWRGGPRIMVGPAGLPGESDVFFENVGGGRFVDATEARGLGDPAGGYGLAVVTTDFDDDGFVDLFVANDSTPNFLYHNRGDGRFESVGLAAGVAINAEARAQAGMGADAGDYDGDGRADIVLTAFAHDNNTVYRNLDGRQFEDATGAAGLRASTFERMGWGTSFLDADLDGRLDLFFVNGHIFSDIGEYPWLRESYAQRNQLLLNRAGRFADVSESAGGGLRLARVGRGLAVGDLDGDGDPDLVVTNMDDSPAVLENRQNTGRRFIGFRVSAPRGNRFGIGARVTIDAGGRRQFREIRSGGSFLSQGDLAALFGLGGHTGPVDVEVRMPGGRTWKWQGLESGRVHTLELADRR
jgi:hypothetical protein